MTSVCVLVPVLSRPHRLEPLVQSLNQSVTDEDATVTMLFLASRGDQPELRELARLNVWYAICPWPVGRSEYPRKINHGASITDSEWLLLGADDLKFHAGWLREALAVHDNTGALVVGTQDMGNQLVKQGKHSTHPFVHRSYLEQGTIDDPGKLYCDLYDHNSCDVEFCETAMFRGVWAFAHKSVVEHEHPLWSRGRVRRDAVYRKGMVNSQQDRLLLRHRRHLWGGPPPPSEPLRRPWPVQARLTGRRQQTARWPR